MKEPFTVKLHVGVYDRQALFRAAVAHYIAENENSFDGTSEELAELARDTFAMDAVELDADGNVTDPDVIDVSACLVQFFDPGLGPDGVEIFNSEAG